MAGPGLLAHVLMAKYADHLLLYRQSTIYAREGVELDRALLASWVAAAGALMQSQPGAYGTPAWHCTLALINELLISSRPAHKQQ
jgi:transposase